MPFPQKLLNEEEDVVLDLRPHWWFLSGPATTVAAAVALSILALVGEWDEILLWPILGVLVVSLVWLGARYAAWATTNFVVTTDRLIYRSGVIAKQGIEIPLERVNNVIFNQSMFERMLRAGDLLIESAGASGQQRFSDIPHPSQVQNEIYRQIESNETRTAEKGARAAAGAGLGRAELSVPEQIEKLAELRDRGILSAEEFDRKKADLLDRM